MIKYDAAHPSGIKISPIKPEGVELAPVMVRQMTAEEQEYYNQLKPIKKFHAFGFAKEFGEV